MISVFFVPGGSVHPFLAFPSSPKVALVAVWPRLHDSNTFCSRTNACGKTQHKRWSAWVRHLWKARKYSTSSAAAPLNVVEIKAMVKP